MTTLQNIFNVRASSLLNLPLHPDKHMLSIALTPPKLRPPSLYETLKPAKHRKYRRAKQNPASKRT